MATLRCLGVDPQTIPEEGAYEVSAEFELSRSNGSVTRAHDVHLKVGTTRVDTTRVVCSPGGSVTGTVSGSTYIKDGESVEVDNEIIPRSRDGISGNEDDGGGGGGGGGSDPTDCPNGYEWDNDKLRCVEKPENECPDGMYFDPGLGRCKEQPGTYAPWPYKSGVERAFDRF